MIKLKTPKFKSFLWPPPELLKTTYILEVILLYCTFFGLILCSNFNHPKSRFCCGPPWVVKNHLYIGGTAEIWEVFFNYIVITLDTQIQEFAVVPPCFLRVRIQKSSYYKVK